MRWLAEAVKISPRNMPAHIGRLNAMASFEKDEDTKEAMKEVATGLSGPRRIYSEEQQ